MKTSYLIVGALFIVAAGFAISALRAQQSGVTRTDLQRHDLSIPGREAIQVRVDIPAGVTAPRHSHPGEEIVYVIDGSLEYRLEGQPAQSVKAGEVVFIPAGTIHSVKNTGETSAVELATYVVEKSKPLITFAK